MIVGDF